MRTKFKLSVPQNSTLTLVLATNNNHKVREIKAILKKCPIKLKVLTLSDFPIRAPVIENQPTLEGNAIKKAVQIAKSTRTLALADDSGLFVKALNGKPGAYSARFAGPGCTFEDNNHKLLRKLKDIPWSKRQAMFRCVAALATPMGNVHFVEGKIQGCIAIESRGKKGFGYDPIFWVPRYKKTFAELSPQIKNKISHRAKAFRQIPSLLRKVGII